MTSQALNEPLSDLTARYARYSRSAGGLSLVIGGVLCLLAFVIGATLELTPPLRYALAGAPLLWLLSKELLRAFLYQRHGHVTERLPANLRRQHRWMVIYLVAICALIIGGVVWSAGARAAQWPGIAYVLFVAALPLVAARWFWSVGDFLVGVLLFCQAAVVIAGGHYPWQWIVIAAAFAAIAIQVGWREHRDFHAIRDALDTRMHASPDGTNA